MQQWSCMTNLHIIEKCSANLLEKENIVYADFLNFIKALDFVYHITRCTKLSTFESDSDAFNCIKSVI